MRLPFVSRLAYEDAIHRAESAERNAEKLAERLYDALRGPSPLIVSDPNVLERFRLQDKPEPREPSRIDLAIRKNSTRPDGSIDHRLAARFRAEVAQSRLEERSEDETVKLIDSWDDTETAAAQMLGWGKQA